ncbi:DDE-type integrase/transposase/recombinase [Albimonas sp. CAU 1670]|uniref:DDE-type integrase/transposase/recombinase n=1 Tax=Albimonas sp. CAU 1670 TaxID=3032599 RepID=UPI0023DCCBCC|nr:DDE-type integrase/transposase/recombinase [Albimonas sp. CAU 1670]MDF2232201.1 DDE-type integrase/transposase/recombinase [Albimonas sp. CAU 1670]
MMWLSAQEIAEAAAAGLMPGMPATKRGVNVLADRKGWATTPQARLRGGREGGGGLEYHVDLLPPAAQLAWLSHHLKVTDEDVRLEVIDGPVDAALDARRVIVRLADKFRWQTLLSQTASDSIFCALFNGDRVDLPGWVRAEAQSLSPRTLARWRKAAAEGAAPGRRGRPKGSGVLDRADGGEVRNLALALMAKHPLINARQLREQIARKYGASLEVMDEATGELKRVPLPSLRMFQVAVGEWKKTYRNEMMRLTDPDGYRSKVEFVATGTQRADRLNEVWQIDASPADIMLTSGRASIYMAVDVYSRRAIVLVTPTPRASAVGLLVRKCIKTWGWPERIHTDNGSDFTAHQTRQLFDSAGIHVELSPPYNPKSKGIVERTIGTFQRDLQVMPGFIGHSVADRKRIEGRKAFHARLGASDVELFDVQLDLAQFQAWADDWTENRFAHTPHEGLGRRTPFMMAAAYAGPVRWLTDEAMLDVLLAPLASNGGLRRVTKQGVRIDHHQYLPMGAQPGMDVLVRMDPHDLGRAMLFTPSGDAFLGEAICPELRGLDPAEVLARAKAMQKAAEAGAMTEIRGKKRELRELARLEVRGVGRPSADLVAFPQRGEAHATPALDAAAEAAGRRQTFEPAKPDPAEEARQAAFVATFPLHKPKPRPETDEERYLRAHVLRRRIAAGGEISADDRFWLDGYAGTPECRSFDGMVEVYGFDRVFPNHARQSG